jgi:hypothetical protein
VPGSRAKSRQPPVPEPLRPTEPVPAATAQPPAAVHRSSVPRVATQAGHVPLTKSVTIPGRSLGSITASSPKQTSASKQVKAPSDESAWATKDIGRVGSLTAATERTRDRAHRFVGCLVAVGAGCGLGGGRHSAVAGQPPHTAQPLRHRRRLRPHVFLVPAYPARSLHPGVVGERGSHHESRSPDR